MKSMKLTKSETTLLLTIIQYILNRDRLELSQLSKNSQKALQKLKTKFSASTFEVLNKEHKEFLLKAVEWILNSSSDIFIKKWPFSTKDQKIFEEITQNLQ